MPRILLGIALLFCSTLLGAVDIPATLAGKWTMTGMVNLDPDSDIVIGGDETKMDALFAADTITMTMGDAMTMKITWKVLAEKPEGIDVEMTGGFFGPNKEKQKSRLVVLADGIVLCHSTAMRMGMKFIRADGKPVGLPPSVQPAQKAVPVVDPNSPTLAKSFTSDIREITLGRTIHFEDGDLTAPKASSASQIQLQIRWPKGLAVLRQQKEAVLTEAVTDAGENLVPPRTKNRNQHFYGGNVYNNQTDLTLPITAPAKPAKTIAKLRATAFMVCERKAAEPLAFKGIKGWVGKEQPFAGGKTVAIVSVEGSELKYRIQGSPNEVIKTVEIRDAAGKLLPSNNSGWSGNNETYTCTVHARQPIPADATVQFTGFGDTTVVEVPIEIKAIPLGEEAPAAAGAALF